MHPLASLLRSETDGRFHRLSRLCDTCVPVLQKRSRQIKLALNFCNGTALWQRHDIRSNVVQIALGELPAWHHAIQGLSIVVNTGRNRTFQQCNGVGMLLAGYERARSKIGTEGSAREVNATRATCQMTGCACWEQCARSRSNTCSLEVNSRLKNRFSVGERRRRDVRCGRRAWSCRRYRGRRLLRSPTTRSERPEGHHPQNDYESPRATRWKTQRHAHLPGFERLRLIRQGRIDVDPVPWTV
jgi:hypothetical protein